MECAPFDVREIGNDHVGLSDPACEREMGFDRLDVVTADEPIISAASLKGALDEVARHSVIHLACNEPDRCGRMLALIFAHDLDGAILRAIIEHDNFVREAERGRDRASLSMAPQTFSSSL